tara:strand:+ start:7837 stop:8349 length:513 start_codon:yes stop_codon:yes gene_type:complete
LTKCSNCGEQIGTLEASVAFDGKAYCEECGVIFNDKGASDFDIKRGIQQDYYRINEEYDARVEAVLLTTETAPNLNITKRIEIVTAECAFGMNVFKDLFAGVRDIVGGRSKAVQQTMRDARRTALYELKVEADLVGANAVVGVDLDYVEISSAGNMVMLVASGTAVMIEA